MGSARSHRASVNAPAPTAANRRSSALSVDRATVSTPTLIPGIDAGITTLCDTPQEL
jgi:hypothetical protein